MPDRPLGRFGGQVEIVGLECRTQVVQLGTGLLQRLVGPGTEVVGSDALVILLHLLGAFLELLLERAGRLVEPLPHLLAVLVSQGSGLFRKLLLFLGGGLQGVGELAVALDQLGVGAGPHVTGGLLQPSLQLPHLGLQLLKSGQRLLGLPLLEELFNLIEPALHVLLLGQLADRLHVEVLVADALL